MKKLYRSGNIITNFENTLFKQKHNYKQMHDIYNIFRNNKILRYKESASNLKNTKTEINQNNTDTLNKSLFIDRIIKYPDTILTTPCIEVELIKYNENNEKNEINTDYDGNNYKNNKYCFINNSQKEEVINQIKFMYYMLINTEINGISYYAISANQLNYNNKIIVMKDIYINNNNIDNNNNGNYINKQNIPLLVFINPRIIEVSSETNTKWENCMSDRIKPKHVEVEYYTFSTTINKDFFRQKYYSSISDDENNTNNRNSNSNCVTLILKKEILDENLSRLFLHEYDHLLGKFYSVDSDVLKQIDFNTLIDSGKYSSFIENEKLKGNLLNI